jgi:hypothetical protein
MKAKNNILSKFNKFYSIDESIIIINDLICDYAIIKFKIIHDKGYSVSDEHDKIYYLQCLKEAFSDPDHFDKLILDEFTTDSLIKYLNDIIYEYSLCIIERLEIDNYKSENCIKSLEFIKSFINTLQDGQV